MSKLTDKLKSVKKSTWITVGSFAAAGILIATSAIGGSRAALTYFSQDYGAQGQMFDIGDSGISPAQSFCPTCWEKMTTW